MAFTKNSTKKLLSLILSVLLILTATVGGTLAYLQARTNPVENTFTPVSVDVAVVGDTVSNVGTTSAWVRVAIAVNWVDSSGNVYGVPPAYTVSQDWIAGGDGLYYWPGIVQEGNSTGSLGIQPSGNAPSGYTLSVRILAEGIQTSPADAFNSWNATGVTISGTSLVKGN